MGKHENIKIEGYEIIYNNKERKGGTIIGVKNNIKHLCIEIEKKVEEYESTWIVLSNGIIRIRIGCIYAPQEGRTNINIFKKMYKNIAYNKLESEKREEEIFIVGDFNCKIGNKISGNKPEIKKSG